MICMYTSVQRESGTENSKGPAAARRQEFSSAAAFTRGPGKSYRLRAQILHVQNENRTSDIN